MRTLFPQKWMIYTLKSYQILAPTGKNVTEQLLHKSHWVREKDGEVKMWSHEYPWQEELIRNDDDNIRGAEFFSRLGNNTQEKLKMLKLFVAIMAQLSKHHTRDDQSHSQECSVLLLKEIEKIKKQCLMKIHFNFYYSLNKLLMSRSWKFMRTHRAFYYVNSPRRDYIRFWK